MNEKEHRRAFDRLPNKLRVAKTREDQQEDSGHGMMPAQEPWEPPDGDVVLERVPDFEQGLDLGDYLTHRVRTNVRWSVVSHSPDGFLWGYAGSGPADLSLNILNMFVPPWTDHRQPVTCYEGEASRTAWELHQQFKRSVIAAAPWEGGTLSGERIREWIQEHSDGANV